VSAGSCHPISNDVENVTEANSKHNQRSSSTGLILSTYVIIVGREPLSDTTWGTTGEGFYGQMPLLSSKRRC